MQRGSGMMDRVEKSRGMENGDPHCRSFISAKTQTPYDYPIRQSEGIKTDHIHLPHHRVRRRAGELYAR